ncbi:hypothetical protein FIBSPDRAFT_1042401 [Athelia psychrophila]|uniref:Uncharacterized protein n=1 Tax=Athelia psychrophila TaxID=1759441 RepID=A0A166ML70_9AGAM|nr:hypothetical protein FIBSPDRAFT_1042401 [Fibularhizoctonia sp. CBS 109695]
MDRELQLRAHVHNLLYDYAKKHLTTDYISFTEDAVTALLSEALAPIPITDPHSFTLPEEPFDALTRILKLTELKPFDEKFTVLHADALGFLRQALRVSGKPRAERIWDEEDPAEQRSILHRPMSPILSLRAIHETPKLGSGSLKSAKIPKSQHDVVKKLQIVQVKEVEQKHIRMEDALHLRPAIDPATLPAMLSLFKSVPTLNPLLFPHKQPSHVESFLRPDSPPHIMPKEEFVPIFCRANRLHGQEVDSNIFKPVPVHPSMPSTLQDLPGMLPSVQPTETGEHDMYKEHMAVVSGWRKLSPSYHPSSDADSDFLLVEAFVPPSPSSLGTPSLGSGTSDVDELDQYLVSPPSSKAKPPLIQELMNAKIDTIAVPRSERLGESLSKKSKSIGDGQRLGSFLAPLLARSQVEKREDKSQDTHPRIVTTPRSSPRSSIGLSVLGQPSSLLESTQNRDHMPASATRHDVELHAAKGDEKDLDLEVREVYAGVVGHGPMDIIMNERLDQKGSMLMDVPHLPAPSVHAPAGAFLPQTWKEVAVGASLKKITGLKPLNMELSWRPFQFGAKVPTNEEVAMVEGLDWDGRDLEEPMQVHVDAAKVNDLLASVQAEKHQRQPRWQEDDDDNTLANLSRSSEFEPILTRGDRRRLAGVPETISDDEDAAVCPLDENNHAGPTTVAISSHSTKPVIGENAVFVLEGIENAEWGNIADDSGISLVDPADYVEEEPFVNSYSSDDDKENIMPLHEHATREGPYPEEEEYTQFEDNRGFEPLSFGSRSNPRSFFPHQLEALPSGPAEKSPSYPDGPEWQDAHTHPEDTHLNFPASTLARFEIPRSQSPSQLLSTPEPTFPEPTFAVRSLAQFLKLKNHVAPAENDNAAVPVAIVEIVPFPIHDTEEIPEVYAAPVSIQDRNTLILPSPWLLPSTVHRYLASVEFVQKRSIVRALATRECSVVLTERETLDGVDIIVDPHTAIIFASLGSLPLENEALASRLADLSWRYSRLLVILEAFSSSAAYKRNRPPSLVNPYTAPTIRAIQKLRRSLAIMDGCDTKRTNTSVHLAFADTVEQAAMFTRCFGDCAEANDTTGGLIWGCRDWLDNGEQEGERDLGRCRGMNIFSAFTMLCQMSLQSFLDLDAEERANLLGQLIGHERAMNFNAELDSRRHVLQDQYSPSSKDEA